jgi:hypothetical protein
VPACPASPIPAAAHAVAPTALAPDQCRSLLDHLAQFADPRQRRGRGHALSAVLAVAACAVLTDYVRGDRGIEAPYHIRDGRWRPSMAWTRAPWSGRRSPAAGSWQGRPRRRP